MRGQIAPAAPAGPERTGPRAGKMQRTAEPGARPRTAPPRGRSGAPHHHQARPRAHRPAGAGPPTRTDRPTSSPSGSRPERARGARAAPGPPNKTTVLTALLATRQNTLFCWCGPRKLPTPEPSRGPARAHTGPNNQATDTRGARGATAGGPRRPGSRTPSPQHAPGQARARASGSGAQAGPVFSCFFQFLVPSFGGTNFFHFCLASLPDTVFLCVLSAFCFYSTIPSRHFSRSQV